MTAPLLTRMRNSPRVMRPIALTVLMAFLMLILEPVAIAAQNPQPPIAAKEKAASSGNGRFAATLESIENHLQRLHEKHSQRQDSTRERGELKQLHQTLKQLDAAERQSFKAIEQHLHEHRLPAEILDRHRAMVEHYEKEYNALTRDLSTIEKAGSALDRTGHVQTALDRLKAQPSKPAPQSFDPKNLPFQVPDGNVRAPKETPDELRQLLQTQRPTPTAAPALAHVPEANAIAVAPQPADLEPTEDVQITDDIKALAQSLNNEPVAIYN